MVPDGCGARALVPHCQRELPMLVDMIDSGEVPEGLSVVGLSTAIDELRGNYPPSAWFEREGWQQPTLIDDANSDGLHALGLPSFPGFVFVDAQGQVTQRLRGEVDRATLIRRWTSPPKADRTANGGRPAVGQSDDRSWRGL